MAAGICREWPGRLSRVRQEGDLVFLFGDFGYLILILFYKEDLA